MNIRPIAIATQRSERGVRKCNSVLLTTMRSWIILEPQAIHTLTKPYLFLYSILKETQFAVLTTLKNWKGFQWTTQTHACVERVLNGACGATVWNHVPLAARARLSTARPLTVTHCLSCHSVGAKTNKANQNHGMTHSRANNEGALKHFGQHISLRGSYLPLGPLPQA